MNIALVPKLQLGNPVQEALASCLFGSDWYPHAWKQLLGLIWSLSTFYRDDSLGKLELPRLVYQAGAWETADRQTLLIYEPNTFMRKGWVKLFPKLQLGNPVQEALASCLSVSHWNPHAWKQLLGLI